MDSELDCLDNTPDMLSVVAVFGKSTKNFFVSAGLNLDCHPCVPPKGQDSKPKNKRLRQRPKP